MMRIVEILIALAIVAALAVGVGLMLPSHGQIERQIEVSNPARLVFDSLNTFRRYPEWSGMRSVDPAARMTISGPESGPGAKASWTSNERSIGNGSLEITESKPDESVSMKLDNGWAGTNKRFTYTLRPSPSGKTLIINGRYDVDYGSDLMARFSGMYINGTPGTVLQSTLGNLSALMAGYPNVDYKDAKIQLVDVPARPVFLVETKAPRTLDDVAEATSVAVKEIEAAIAKAGLTAAGPPMTITTEWGDEEYIFTVAVPVSATGFTLAGQSYAIEPPATRALDAEPAAVDPATLKVGDKDARGYTFVEGNVRATQWYEGKALMAEYTGSPAALPLYRLNLKAYAETHGYKYSDGGLGRFWDEAVPGAVDAEGQLTYREYLPVRL